MIASDRSPMSGLSGSWARRLVTRPATAALILLAVYIVLGLMKEPRAHMSTDTGMRAATILTMERNGGLAPDVEYWAQRWDSDGTAHPLAAGRMERAWTGVGTLPTLYVERALLHLGGTRGPLLVPILGSVLTALGAWYLARRAQPNHSPPVAVFWIVGLGSPAAVYALDLWDHAIGLGMMTWGIAFLLDCRAPHEKLRWWPRAVGAGLLLGAAMTLRAEVAVFSMVTLGVVGLGLLAKGRPKRALAVGALFALAFLVPILLNQALEQRAVGAVMRPTGGFSRGTPPGNVLDGVELRVDNAVLTTFGMRAYNTSGVLVTAAALVGFLVLALRRARAGDHLAKLAMAGVVFLYGAASVQGFGFIPSLFAAAPIALIGVLGVFRTFGSSVDWRSFRPHVAIALLSLPLVWLTSPTDGAAPQWGGRYVLMSGVLLTPVGIAALWPSPRWLRRCVVGLTVAVTVFGVSFLFVRTHRVAAFMERIERRPEQVLVSTEGFLWREGGSFYEPDRRWLIANGGSAGVANTASIVRRAGYETFALIEVRWSARRVSVPGFCAVGRSDRLDFLGHSTRVTSYQASDRC